MNYQVKNVELYNAIICDKEIDNGNGILRLCTTTTTLKNLEPQKKDFIKFDCIPTILEIPKGCYLFVQGLIKEDAFTNKKIPHIELYKAAEELWLEFLWQNIKPLNNKIYVRLLLNENNFENPSTGQKKTAGIIFQLYRQTQKALSIQ